MTCGRIHVAGTIISWILWVLTDRQCAQHNPCCFFAPVINQLFRRNVQFNPIGYCTEPIQPPSKFGPLCDFLRAQEETCISRGVCQAQSYCNVCHRGKFRTWSFIDTRLSDPSCHDISFLPEANKAATLRLFGICPGYTETILEYR